MPRMPNVTSILAKSQQLTSNPSPIVSQHSQQMTSSNEIFKSDSPFFMLSEDLVPSIPPSLPARISLDFSGLLDPPLIIESDRKEGCGGQLWPAGKVLAKYLLQCKMDGWRGKTMFVRSDVFSTSC